MGFGIHLDIDAATVRRAAANTPWSTPMYKLYRRYLTAEGVEINEIYAEGTQRVDMEEAMLRFARQPGNNRHEFYIVDTNAKS